VGKALDAVEKAFEAEELTLKERAALGMELLRHVKLTEAAGRSGNTNASSIRRDQRREELFGEF